MRTVRGLLLDLDGTLYEDESPVPGAVEAVAELRRIGVELRFVTNTTRRPRRAIRERLGRMGLEADLHELVTAPLAAVDWLGRRGIRRVALCVASETCEDFAQFEIDETSPEAVIVGDLGPAWSFERLNRAFGWLLGGSALVALQKNRYWKSRSGLVLDAGPWVAALEYASGRRAEVVGKPSPAFFRAAARSIGLEPQAVAVVGDDLVSDVGGAQAVGAAGILVRTGKFRPRELEASAIRPTAIIDSVARLPELVGGG